MSRSPRTRAATGGARHVDVQREVGEEERAAHGDRLGLAHDDPVDRAPHQLARQVLLDRAVVPPGRLGEQERVARAEAKPSLTVAELAPGQEVEGVGPGQRGHQAAREARHGSRRRPACGAPCEVVAENGGPKSGSLASPPIGRPGGGGLDESFIEAYEKGVDRTLLGENPKASVEERVRKRMAASAGR